jgi:asparagine synthetase B (glutamine-hydrolysing)
MCGIFGISLGRGLNESEQDFVKRDIINFAKLSLKRGSDTFGINIIVDDWNYVFKSSSNPNSAINRKDYKKFIDNKLVKACKNKKSFNYFGQTRLVTNGTKFLYKNNQPIVTNNIIGLHNGILFFPDENNKDDKTKNYESFNIKSDSLNFFEQLNNAIEKKK